VAETPNNLGNCTDLNSLCYNSFTGQGQLLWVRVACSSVFGQRFSLVSMVSINLGIWFYGVETGDAGESIEPFLLADLPLLIAFKRAAHRGAAFRELMLSTT
jgi:hypothetical protein